MSFAEKLIAARKAQGMTQAQLAAVMHIDRSAVSHWERGRSQPGLDTIRQLEQVLNAHLLSEEALFTESPAETEREAASPEAPAEAAPRRRISRRGWIAIAAGAALLLALAVILILTLTRRQTRYTDKNGQVYTVAQYQQEAANDPAGAFLRIDKTLKTAEHGNASFYMYRFDLYEMNGVGFTIDRLENAIFADNRQAVVYLYSGDELAAIGLDPAIAPSGSWAFEGGLPVQPLVGIGMQVTGTDAGGAQRTFTAWMPVPDVQP